MHSGGIWYTGGPVVDVVGAGAGTAFQTTSGSFGAGGGAGTGIGIQATGGDGGLSGSAMSSTVKYTFFEGVDSMGGWSSKLASPPRCDWTVA
jgi:hypothetical protein